MAVVLNPSLGATLAAIVAALEVDATLAAWSPEVYGFEGTLEEFVQEASSRAPSVAVVYAGGQDEPRGAWDGVHHAEWVCLVMDVNLRDERSRRAPASSSELGAWALAEAVRAALTNSDLGLDGLTPLKPAAIEQLGAGQMHDRRMAAYAIPFLATHDWLEVAPEQVLETIVATYETPNGDGDWADQVVEEPITITES